MIFYQENIEMKVSTMNTFQLSCFLAVANTLNFAQTAKQVNISQPAITNQIKSLEKELDTKLFCRITRMVELTAEGQAFRVFPSPAATLPCLTLSRLF